MNDIDPQQFGEYRARVHNNEKAILRIENAIKEGVNEVATIVKDHIKKEEKANNIQNERIKVIEEFISDMHQFKGTVIFLLRHWKAITFLIALVLVLVLGFGLPALRRIILELTNGEIDLSFLSYYINPLST